MPQGAFYEKFVEGHIVKTWFWNDLPVCYEWLPMLYIDGDGVNTIQYLVMSHVKRFKNKFQLEKFKETLGIADIDINIVLPKGERKLIEFRYASLIMNRADIKNNILLTNKDSLNIKTQLDIAGKVLWDNIKNKIESGFVYSVDSIIDKKGVLWFLEANSNPVIHPALYPVMLFSLARDMSEKFSPEENSRIH